MTKLHKSETEYLGDYLIGGQNVQDETKNCIQHQSETLFGARKVVG